MNYLTRLLLGLGFAIPMSVWAAPFGPTPPEDEVYLNLSYYGVDGALYLEQSNGQCVKNMPYFLNLDGTLLSVTCVASEKIGDSFKETYNKVIKMTGSGSTSESRWKPKNANPLQFQSTVLKLASDIDLKGFDADGKNCSETKTHDPLDFYGATLDGLNHTISNFCRADNGHMDQSFGLFSELAGKTVQNLTISNVDYKVTDKQPEYAPASNDAGDYQPAGALAPTIFSSTIKNIKLEKISIQAPLAGGLAGYIENSSIGSVFTTEGSNISITNDRRILNGYIGYTVYDNNYTNNIAFQGYRIVSGEQEQYKVLLGGLAGASMFTTFQDIDIAVQVKNNAEVAMSGLGGLVGHYVYARVGGTKEKAEFQNIKIHGVKATAGFIVSGGTAMGGVLGASNRVNEFNSPKVPLVFSDVHVVGLNMQNSKVYIKTPLVEPYDLYLGGIVGNGGLCGGGNLQILESTVENFSIEESLPGNCAFKYYIGGVAGYANCENTNNFTDDETQGLTLKKTNANGSIKLDGGKSSGSGGKVGLINRVSATIGGLVGAAVLSVAEKAVSENNSRVSIDYSAKRVSSATDADTVLVGGVFGAASIFNTNTREVDLTDLSYQGTLSVVDDGVTTRIGGIIGTFPLFLTGDPRIAFSNDHVRAAGGTNLIEYTHTGGESDGTSLAMGGICGLCRSPREVSENTVEGSFVWKMAQEASAAPQKESNVGGLIGLVQANADVRNDKKNKYEIKNNSFVGNMSAAFNKGKGKAGYLVGTMIGDGLGNKPEIISNFHKGSDNFGAIGYFNNYGQYYNIKFFNEHEIDNEGNVLDNTLDKFVAKNNVRSGLVKDLQDGKNGSTMNGVVTEDYMKSEVFAAFLNLVWDDADRKWTFDKSVNDYPYIGKTSAEGGSPVSPEDINFEVKFVGLDAKGKEKTETQQVKYGENAVLPKSEDFPAAVDGKCFDAWDGDYTNVTSDMTITAQYVTCTYTVKFVGLDAKGKEKTEKQQVKYGENAVLPKSEDFPAAVDGKCFDAWDGDYTNVTSDMTITAQYVTCTYTVKFVGLDAKGKEKTEKQQVKYGENAVLPKSKDFPVAVEGKCFDAWDGDYTNVTSDMTITAQYVTCTYTVKFVGLDAKGKEKTEKQQVEYGKNADLPKSEDFPAAVEGKCFDAWDGDYANVTSDVTITAQYVTCTYTVKFTNEDGTKTFKTEEVEYSKGATAPTDLDLPDGLCLDHWVGSFDNVKSDLTIKAKTMSCGKSSSSSSENISVSSSSCSAGNSEISSSSSSSSKGGKSSSSIKGKSSSSSAKSSSSSSAGKGKSSSSKNNQYEIAKPTVQQDGDALRMVFDNALAESFEKVRIQVESDAGIYLDTTIKRKYVEKAKNGTWRLDPAPVGIYTVTFTLIDGDKVSSYEERITNKKTTKEYISHAWQTLSLNAFCYNKGDECLSELEARFARVQSDWAKEECRHMQDEIKRGMNDDQFYQEMLDVCAQANGSGAVTSVYWWDETNPVGDFWQYRKFSVKDKFEPTRGYWYGPDEQEPPEMSLQTPNMNDTIVWKLENKYSGWNLVANPYGWYVKLPKDENVDFCQWNPETSGYVVPEVLGPYEALWVHTKKSMTYRIPLKASIVLEGEKKALSKSAVSESWNLRVVLADDNGKRDSWNEIAAGRTAKTLSEPPAGMGDHVNLSIVEGKNRLAKSVKTNADDLEWDLEVSATTTRAGHLSFEGLESVWAKGMHVYATVDNETVEVVKDSPVDVKLSSKAKNVSVRVTKGAKPVNIAKGLLKGLHVGQASNVLNVGFDAASKLAGANVKVSIVGVDGRIVATNRAVAREGSNAVSMKKPKQGVYFVKVKVGGQSAVARVMVR